jgi:hypothetical protein
MHMQKWAIKMVLLTTPHARLCKRRNPGSQNLHNEVATPAPFQENKGYRSAV